MTRIFVHVEGETEENFVNDVLAPYLNAVGRADVRARLIGNARQRSKRGGIRSWEAVRKDIVNGLIKDQSLVATTMVDYYGLHESWPGRAESRGKVFDERAFTVEDRMRTAISSGLCGFDPRRFIPYVVTHEFEGLLFSDPEGFALGIARPDLSPQLQTIRNDFTSPEEINDSETTAPSKRVLKLIPGYQKPFNGVQAAREIGLDTIRKECPLFDKWIEKLEQAVHLFDSHQS